MNDIRTMVSLRWRLLRMSTKIGITEATLCLLVLLLFQNFTKSAIWHSRLSKIKPGQYSENQWDIKDLQKLRNKRQVQNENTEMEYDFEVSEEGPEPPKNIQEILTRKSSKDQKYLQDTLSKLLSKTTNASRLENQDRESKNLQDLSNPKKIDNRQDYDSYPDQFFQKIFKDVTNIQNDREENYKDVQVDSEKFLWDKNKSVLPIIESVDKIAKNTTLLKFARSQNKSSSVDKETLNKSLARSSSTSESGSREEVEKQDDSEKTQSLETNHVYAPDGITEIHLVNSIRAKGLSGKFQAYLNNSLTKRHAWMKNIEKRISILENDFRHIFRCRDKMSSMKNQQEPRKRSGKVSKTCRSVKCYLGTSRSNPVRPGGEAQKVPGESWRLRKQDPGEEEELDGHFTSAGQVKFSELPKNSTEVSGYHEVSSKDDYWDNRPGRPAASSTVQDYRTMRELIEGREHVMSSKNSRGYQSKMAGKHRRNTNKRNNVKELPGYVTRDPEEDDYSHIGRRRILARVGQGSDKHPRELPAEEKRTRGQIDRTDSWPKYITKLRTLALPESLFTNQRSVSKRFQVPIIEPRINDVLDPPVHKNIQRSIYNRDDNKSPKRITRQRSHSRDTQNDSKIMETQIPKPRGGLNLGRVYSNPSGKPLDRTRYTITGRNASSNTYLGDNVKPVAISSSQIPRGGSTMATTSKIHESIVPSSYSELSGPAADWGWTLRENTPSWRMFVAGQESRSVITQPSPGSLMAPLVENHQESQTQESRVQEAWNPILPGPLDYYTQGQRDLNEFYNSFSSWENQSRSAPDFRLNGPMTIAQDNAVPTILRGGLNLYNDYPSYRIRYPENLPGILIQDILHQRLKPPGENPLRISYKVPKEDILKQFFKNVDTNQRFNFVLEDHGQEEFFNENNLQDQIPLSKTASVSIKDEEYLENLNSDLHAESENSIIRNSPKIILGHSIPGSYQDQDRKKYLSRSKRSVQMVDYLRAAQEYQDKLHEVQNAALRTWLSTQNEFGNKNISNIKLFSSLTSPSTETNKGSLRTLSTEHNESNSKVNEILYRLLNSQPIPQESLRTDYTMINDNPNYAVIKTGNSNIRIEPFNESNEESNTNKFKENTLNISGTELRTALILTTSDEDFEHMYESIESEDDDIDYADPNSTINRFEDIEYIDGSNVDVATVKPSLSDFMLIGTRDRIINDENKETDLKINNGTNE